ncbi:ribosomal protein S7 [Laetiporus sulphureus 93-53]|uniref:Ribosomal protein S7 n=1 Tax=Laetiporus sulphureus 93-53 TaxID=1314785 RepID=A0A165GDS0_9APHY|nr:ribosomal protein S7 [Laetiporus sulphureus 93-53]KZT10206.1 ribosomal protein S7 [Laetiporus sulphureus 93-53]
MASVEQLVAQKTLPARPLVNPVTPAEINIPPAEDPLLQFLTSCFMKDGKRQKAARVTSQVLLYIHTLTRSAPLPLLRTAIEAVAPAVRCITNKHAGKTVVYPVPLSEKQRAHTAIKWIVQASDSRKGRKMEIRVAKEIIAIIQGMDQAEKAQFSTAYKRKEEVHRYAMANRGNAGRNA